MRKIFWMLLVLLVIWPPYSNAKTVITQDKATLTWDAHTTYEDGNESGFSNEGSKELVDGIVVIPPSEPSGLSCE